jgi:hypothetical protein
MLQLQLLEPVDWMVSCEPLESPPSLSILEEVVIMVGGGQGTVRLTFRCSYGNIYR